MAAPMQIRGGAEEAEAAAVVAVVGYVLEMEAAARARRPESHTRPPAWMRAGWPRHPDDPLDVILPDHRGDPL